MVYDAQTYSETFKINGRYLHPKTILRRARQGTLPTHTIVHKLKGMVVFEVPDQIPQHIKDNFTVLLRSKQ
jgi:hypothetical protein